MEIVLDSRQEERALRLHNDSLVIDMHTDVHLDVVRARGQGEKKVFERRHLPRWKKGGVNVVVLSSMAKYGPDPYPYRTSPVHNFLLMADAIQEEIAESSGHLFLVLRPDDILRAQKEDKIGFILGMEGAEGVEDNLAFLRSYYRLGLRIMNLTWHQRNQVADGEAEPSNSGLSNFGRALVKEMNRLGVIIDVSHLSSAGVKDALELSEQPIIASHSNARAVCKHQRNLEDWQIKGIAEKGGIMGAVFLANFVAAENPNVSHILDHIDYIAKMVGTKHVGMGPDYTDFCQDMIIPTRSTVHSDLPINAKSIPYAEGVEDATKLVNFTRGLASRGYTDDEIRGILGENFLCVFKKIYKGS